MQQARLLPCLIVLFFLGSPVFASEATISDATLECLDCHTLIHPGIVQDWQASRHAKITPASADAVQGTARKLSATQVPEHLRESAVGCAECHTLRPDAHADTFEHNGYDIHVVVSPADCATCHAQEQAQYGNNVMAHAYANLADNPLYRKLQVSIIGNMARNQDELSFEPADAATRAEACYYCHGTRLKVAGREVRNTEIAGELEFPIIEGWPNQGVGRVNLDGSLGSCAACHARHTFSMAMARKPYSCKECHIGPDVPAFKVYTASKHGNIFSSLENSWNFDAVPWTIGEDFKAPTCAACHMSLLVNTEGEVVSERSHQMSDRLPWRIFGLVYAHPQPKSPNTTGILNKDGQPLPTALDGTMSADYLIDAKTQNSRRSAMQASCLSCHDSSWVKGHWQRFEATIQKTNRDILTATGIMQNFWQEGYADLKTNPFDEAIEKKWTDAWQFYANAVRFASAMGGGGDYGVYADGRYQLSQTILEMNERLKLYRGVKSALGADKASQPRKQSD
jgi:hypothetical protein